MSWYAYGITADGEQVPLAVSATTDPTGLVIPSVHLDGQAFARVEVHPMPGPLLADMPIELKEIPFNDPDRALAFELPPKALTVEQYQRAVRALVDSWPGMGSTRRGGKLTTMRQVAREVDASTASTPWCGRCRAPVTVGEDPASRHIADEHDDPGTGAPCRGGAVCWSDETSAP